MRTSRVCSPSRFHVTRFKPAAFVPVKVRIVCPFESSIRIRTSPDGTLFRWYVIAAPYGGFCPEAGSSDTVTGTVPDLNLYVGRGGNRCALASRTAVVIC